MTFLRWGDKKGSWCDTNFKARVMSMGLKWVSKNCKFLQNSSNFFKKSGKIFKIFQKNSIFFGPF
jgi:hypothetical protein